jgi:S-adenosylmethionine uptake transporter
MPSGKFEKNERLWHEIWGKADMRLTSNMEGAVLMTASMAAFTFNDMLFKLLNDDLPFFQVLFLRSLLACILLAAMIRYRGAWMMRFSGPDWRFILLRSAAEVAAAYFFLTALVHMPIANVTAILQALPLTVTLAAALFLKEPVGWRRFVAILIGLVGVLLIVRPGSADFNIYAIYAVMAVLCVTIRDLAVRRMSEDVPSMMVAFISSIGVLVFGGVGALFVDWQSLDSREYAMLAGASFFILGAYVFSVMAMRVGDIGFVSPFRYTSLLVALVLGLLVFGEWPDFVTLLGAGIVVATGLFTIWREQRLGVE